MRLEDFLRRGANEYPARTAISYLHDGVYRQLSYAQLNDKTQFLASGLEHHLDSLPFNGTQFIGIFIPRNVGQVIAILATLAAGAAYVPIALDSTVSNFRTVFDQTKMRVVIAEASQLARLDDLLSQAGCEGVVVVDVDKPQTSNSHRIGIRHLSPADPAYVLFSSGTTGTPKGIVVSHSAVHAYCKGANLFYHATKDDKWVRAAVYTFDPSIDEMFCPLTIGAEMVIQPANTLASFPSYLKFLEDTGGTIVLMTTALWHTFAGYIVQEKQHLPPKLRILSIGGEAGLMSIFKAWHAAVGEYPKIMNGYGPTEVTVSATYWEANDEAETHVMPIGRPLPDYECYVLDPATKSLAERGEEGLMFISGPGLAIGYLDNPTLTEQRFVPNPWAKSAEYGRMYNTGDLVRMDQDGVYHFRGREDLQVKIRGFRIEPEAIEACLLAHPSVREVAVISASDQETHSLRAFIVVTPDEENSVYAEDLVEHCRKTLAHYEIPAQFFKVKKLPHNSSQKLDRRALALLTAERFPFVNDPTGTLELDHDDINSVLAELWQECLVNVSATSLHGRSNFIQLGGHSLTCIILAAKIHSTMGYSVSAIELLQNATLSQMSKLLDECQPSPPLLAPSFSSVEAGESQIMVSSMTSPDGGTYPLYSAQARLYTAHQKWPDNPVLNDGLAIKIHGPVSLENMRGAIQSIIRRHHILRIMLALDDQAEVYQRVLPFDEVFDQIFAHSTLQQADVAQRVSAIYSKPFNLFEPPLLRIVLLSSTESEHVLVVCAHHIIWDGFSDGIFLQELSALYQGKKIAPTISFFDCCVGLQPKHDADQLSSLVSYLKSVPDLLELPIDFVRPEVQTFNRGRHLHFDINYGTVFALAHRLGSTPHSCLMTVFALTLHLCAARQVDFTVGVPFTNRTRVEVANVIGFFMNVLPLRVKFTNVRSLDDLHATIHKDLLFLSELQHVPFDSVVSSLGVALNYKDAPEGELNAQTRFSPFPVTNGAAHLDLTCFIEVAKDGVMRGEFEYDSGIFAHSTMESLAGAFNRILDTWSAEPAQTIDGLTFGESSAHIPSVPSPDLADNSFGAFLASRAIGFSDRQAVYDDTTGTSYTYRELYSMSNRVQERVRPFKRPQGMVMLLLERNADVVAAEIGVSLAGMAWVPCDIFQPLSRIQDIAEDARPVSILAHRNVLKRLGASKGDFSVPILFVDELFDDLTSVGPENIVADNASDVAYMIYTSGSTGKPKGIAIGHFSIIGLIREIISWIDNDMSYNSVATCNVAWDTALELFYSSLATGGCLKLPKMDGEKDGEYLSQLLKASPAVNTVGATSAAIRMWLDQAGDTFFPDGMFTVSIGGDELRFDCVQRIFDSLSGSPSARVLHAYGPTEGTVFNSYSFLTRRDLNSLARFRRTPIDTLLPYAAMTVVNPAGNELPRGFVGEIVIWGSCLLLEYWNRPELNQQKFLIKDGIRGWRSGDFGRHLPCGKFEIFGRMDSMCKVKGGFRVELGEIDAQIRAHPEVTDCYVSVLSVAGKTSSNGTDIVAHIVFKHRMKPSSGPTGAAELTSNPHVLPPPSELTSASNLSAPRGIRTSLYRHLSNRIPTYVNYVVQIEALPLTSATKVDKTRLPLAGAADRFHMTNEDISIEWNDKDEAQGPTVEVILRIFSTVLCVDRELLPRDNFYNYGGNSLVATRVTNLIRRELDVPLPFTAIITNPTASELARFVDSMKEDSARRVRLPPNIIPLQPSRIIREPKAIMVVFHFVGGDLDMLPRVVNQLDNEELGLATYGLQWEPGQNLNSYDKLADAYCESISTLAGSLPCFLIGLCYGGMIATRVAQKLPRATTHVILIDVPHPNELGRLKLDEKDYAKTFVFYLSKVGFNPRLTAEDKEKIIQVLLDIKPDWHDTAALIAVARAHGDLPVGVTDEDLRRYLYPLADSYDLLLELYGTHRFEEERHDMEARVVLHLQAADGANMMFPGIPYGLGWERYEILDDTDHDTIGYIPAAQARFLAVVRQVLLPQSPN
ncbi:hypothetical protein C8R44DRAFT_846569 [Mycena epipterygia]|nr:hypothetical protein C8R44DRAFT_846569 [Mycena epipterygia]